MSPTTRRGGGSPLPAEEFVLFVITCLPGGPGKLLQPGKMPPGEKMPGGSDCHRFVLSNPDVDACMTGPKNREQVPEALRALDLGPLSEEEAPG